jgi:hypothetical protein
VPQEYEQSQPIVAPPEEVFAWLSDVGNLPEYLPPVVASSAEGPSVESVPGQRIRATLESIRKQIEEGSGKVEAPPLPEGAEPHPETNPAVVDEDS